MSAPNPGSPEAQSQGCICPVLDNARGRGYMGGNGLDYGQGGMFVMVSDCPVHPDGLAPSEDS